MYKKTTVTLAVAMLFVFTVALPASANTDTDESTVETTSVVTTETPKAKMSFEELVALWKEKLSAKKEAISEAKNEVKTQTKESRALGTSLKNVDASCIVDLVDTREVSLQNAWATFNTSMADALKARHEALVAAWNTEEVTDRAQDIKDAWKSWKKSHKEIFTTLKEARKSAWSTFKTEAKNTCKVTVPAEEKLTVDSSGSISL